MDSHLGLAFLASVIVLMLIPGPNVALIVANSVGHGARHGLATVLGTSAANAAQVALAGLGLSTVLGQAGSWFDVLRWAGVAYLLCLGVRQWRAEPVDLTRITADRVPLGRLVQRGLLVGATNPKTLFFYGAFFPQFIVPSAPPGPQVLVLGVTLVATAMLIDCGWALLADRLRPLLARHGRARNRLTGGLMIGAGATLALTHRG